MQVPDINAANTLLTFWKNYKQTLSENTTQDYIAPQDYQILQSAGILTKKLPLYNSQNTLLYSDLPCEPFVGNIKDAKIYIITLNPGCGEDEHKNWENKELLDIWGKNLTQDNPTYPFYYLDPRLANTGGGIYWTGKSKFQNVIQEIAPLVGGKSNAIQFISQNVCDIEFCPYHSETWDGNNTKIIKNLPSFQTTLTFIKDYVIPDVINGTKALLVLRSLTEIKALLSGIEFDYNNGKITFDELEKTFPDRVVFYGRDFARKASLNPHAEKSSGGKVLLQRLKNLIL